jgi:hypothetical protein
MFIINNKNSEPLARNFLQTKTISNYEKINQTRINDFACKNNKKI